MEWWSHVAVEITLPELVKAGFLAPIMVQCLPVNITLPKFGKEIPAEQADALLQPVLETIAREIYRADGVAFSADAERRLAELEASGFGDLPVCMAKTQYSFSADPKLRNAPTGHTIPVREVRLSAGAGFVVALTGDVMTMPGLPSVPAAEHIFVDADGIIGGLS